MFATYLPTESAQAQPVQIPTAGTVSADPGLSFVLQTADGLYHTTNFSTTGSVNLGTNNGRTNWAVFDYNLNTFSPVIASSGRGSQVNKIAIVFAGVPDGVNSINLLLSPGTVPAGGGGFWVLVNYVPSGLAGFFANPPGTGSLANFAVLATPPDNRFNFELSGPNN